MKDELAVMILTEFVVSRTYSYLMDNANNNKKC